MCAGSHYIQLLTVWYCLVLHLGDRGANDDVATRTGPALQFDCVSGGKMVVVNPVPDVFKYAFVTLETDTDLLHTSWENDHRTLTIYLPDKGYNVLVRFSTRDDVIIGNHGLVYRITCAGYSTQPDTSYLKPNEGIKAVESVIRQGGYDGRQVTGGVVSGDDLFWTIQTFEDYTMRPLNCTISAGEKPFYSESSVIVIDGCSTDKWIMDDFTSVQNDGNDSTLYYTRLHTFRFYSHTYLTVLCKLRVCPVHRRHVCLIKCQNMKRYYANEPGQPEDVLYTHIEFTLLIQYSHNKGTRSRGVLVQEENKHQEKQNGVALRLTDKLMVIMLISNPHSGLKAPGNNVSVVKGGYYYYHYGCDGQDDRGWGCGYRTLQSLCSWTIENFDPPSTRDVPSIPEIQEALVNMRDKEERFRGSRDWIGSVEVGLCLDYFFNVPCKIEHITQGAHLDAHSEVIEKHFEDFGSPIMMGGDSDSSSKGICGICTDVPSLLVMDPHYYSQTSGTVTREDLQTAGWVSWKLVEDFDQQSFYNLCLPQLKAKQRT